MTKLSLRDLDVRGKRVLVRVDFNVPTELRGGKVRITDDTRIRESLPTINYLREHGAKTILMSHFGRPKGKPVEKYSLRPIGDYLHSLIHHPVIFSHDTIGEVPEKIVEHMQDGDVALLENVRFQPGKKRTIRILPKRSPVSAIFTLTMRLAPLIARTPPRWGSQNLWTNRPWVS